MRVFVTDADNRIALAVIRALGRAGHEVTLGLRPSVNGRSPLCAVSAYVGARVMLPSRDDPSAAQALERVLPGHDVAIPVSINEIFHAVRNRERFARAGTALPFPDETRLHRANAKSELLPLAQTLGLEVPRTWAPEGESELAGAEAEAPYPLIVKLRDDEGTSLPPHERYELVPERSAFRAAWDRLHARRPWPLVQEFIRGAGYGVSVLCGNGGAPVATLVHRRVREYPLAGGPSTCAESVSEPTAVDLAHRLLRALDWTGVAMVEFKREVGTGRWVLMEINPRFWGSLPLAEAAGINFPDLLCRMARGQPVPTHDPEIGVRVQFSALDALGAVRAAVSEGRMEVMDGFLRDLCDPEVVDGLWAWDDLRPAFRYFRTRLAGGRMSG